MVTTQPTSPVVERPSKGATVSLREFGELLKRHRERNAMTQNQAATQVGVSRPNFAQWEAGKHLPGEDRVHELDRLLRAEGELVAAAEELRPAQRTRPLAPAAGRTSLVRMFAEIRHALLDQLCEVDGRPVGWRHNLVPSGYPPSVLSTAYGLKVLALLGGPDSRTQTVVDWVLGQAVRSDDRIIGWQARAQDSPRLETTAAALDALLRAGVPFTADSVIRILGDLVDDETHTRPFILATALEPLLRVAPESDLTAELVQALLDCRISIGEMQLWPEKLLRRSQPLLQPSTAHTARAVTVLRNAPEHMIGDALTSVEPWISEAQNLDGVTEIIRRHPEEDRTEEMSYHHFTSTWVVRALAGAQVPDERRIDSTMKYVWGRYDHGLHFWAWGNGDVPVWMLADAIAAVQDAALALLPGPGDSHQRHDR